MKLPEEYNGMERRKQKRIRKIDWVALETNAEPQRDAAKIICQAMTQDISMAGLRVQCHDFLAVNTPVKINLTLSHTSKYLSIFGKVCWVRDIHEGETFEYGFEFQGISPQASVFLLEHIYGH